MPTQFKYFAFISYSSKDTTWGKKLQRKLEHYSMPATLCQERGWKRKPMDPVFFAPTDIQPGELTEEIQERLRASQYLIVICSPNSAQSEWVGKEIAFFHSLERTKTSISLLWKALRIATIPTQNVSTPLSTNSDCPKFLVPTSTRRFTAGHGSTKNELTCNSSPNCSAWSLMPSGNGTSG